MQSEDVTFTLECSDDYVGDWFFKVYKNPNMHPDTLVYSQSEYLSAWTGDVRQWQFTVEGGSIPVEYVSGEQDVWLTYRYVAVMESDGEVYDSDLDIELIAKSNVISLDMMHSVDFEIQDSSHISSQKNYSFKLYYFARPFDRHDRENLNTYQVNLYDEDKQLIKSLGSKYDWDGYHYSTHSVTIPDLEDGKTYYIKAFATSVSGYETETDFWRVDVNYIEYTYDDDLVLTNNTTQGCIEIGYALQGNTYDKIIIERSRKYTEEWTRVIEYDSPAMLNVRYKDYFAKGKEKYLYRISCYSGDTVVVTKVNEVYSDFDCMVVVDNVKVYHSIAEATWKPLVNNKPKQVIETLGNKTPFVISNGEPNYWSGTVTSVMLTEVDECLTFDYEASVKLRQDFADG